MNQTHLFVSSQFLVTETTASDCSLRGIRHVVETSGTSTFVISTATGDSCGVEGGPLRKGLVFEPLLTFCLKCKKKTLFKITFYNGEQSKSHS